MGVSVWEQFGSGSSGECIICLSVEGRVWLAGVWAPIWQRKVFSSIHLGRLFRLNSLSGCQEALETGDSWLESAPKRGPKEA